MKMGCVTEMAKLWKTKGDKKREAMLAKSTEYSSAT
jgi:hypothetical protein